jgi:hypothetical protein
MAALEKCFLQGGRNDFAPGWQPIQMHLAYVPIPTDARYRTCFRARFRISG